MIEQSKAEKLKMASDLESLNGEVKKATELHLIKAANTNLQTESSADYIKDIATLLAH